MKKRISLLLVLMLIFSSISISYASLKDENLRVFDKYMNEKQHSNTRYNSREYIQKLINSGVDFEVTVTYYDLSDQSAKNVSKSRMIKTHSITSKNTMPFSKASGDFSTTEISHDSLEETVDTESAIGERILGLFIKTAVSKSHPLGGIVVSALDLSSTPQERWGRVSVESKKSYRYSDVWYEIDTGNGPTAMVITESRRTNIIFLVAVVDKLTGRLESETDDYNCVKLEYSRYFGDFIRNRNEAIDRYNMGYGNPRVYGYTTGEVIDNSHIIPEY